jgi:hypothetical protein
MYLPSYLDIPTLKIYYESQTYLPTYLLLTPTYLYTFRYILNIAPLDIYL